MPLGAGEADSTIHWLLKSFLGPPQGFLATFHGPPSCWEVSRAFRPPSLDTVLQPISPHINFTATLRYTSSKSIFRTTHELLDVNLKPTLRPTPGPHQSILSSIVDLQVFGSIPRKSRAHRQGPLRTTIAYQGPLGPGWAFLGKLDLL